MTGPEIRELRLSLGWSQSRLANYLDTRRATVSDWEREKSHPNPVYVKLMKQLKPSQ